MNERPLSNVPRLIVVTLLLAFVLQVGLRSAEGPPPAKASDLETVPTESALQLAAFGDPVPLGKLLMLYLQSFDLRADNQIRYHSMDYDKLIGWLARILSLDPVAQYPLHAASRIYAEVPDPERKRKMLEFVYGEFFADPEKRWPWLAHAAYIAKHELKDLPLARRYASAIQSNVHGADVPLWAKQMEAFILEDMNELEAAKIMIGGFIASGRVTEPGELRLLEEKLKQIEAKLKKTGSATVLQRP